MFVRLLLGAVLLAGLVSVGTYCAAADDQAGTHSGLVVSVENNKLTMTDNGGKNQHTHMVPTTATITCDGKPCRLQDLEKGMQVQVTTAQQGDKNVVVRVDAKKAIR